MIKSDKPVKKIILLLILEKNVFNIFAGLEVIVVIRYCNIMALAILQSVKNAKRALKVTLQRPKYRILINF